MSSIEEIDKTLLGRTFVRASKQGCKVNNVSALNDTCDITGVEARNFYESLTSIKEECKLTEDNTLLCNLCQTEVSGTFNDHLSSISHQVVELLKQPLKPSPFLIPPSNRGYQIMTRIGWSDNVNEKRQNDFADDEDRNSYNTVDCKGGGLGPGGRGRRYPIPTVLKRNRLGFGWEAQNKVARITHFHQGDVKAVENFRNPKNILLKSIKLDKEFLSRKIRKEKLLERRLRMEFNWSDDKLAVLQNTL